MYDFLWARMYDRGDGEAESRRGIHPLCVFAPQRLDLHFMQKAILLHLLQKQKVTLKKPFHVL